MWRKSAAACQEAESARNTGVDGARNEGDGSVVGMPQGLTDQAVSQTGVALPGIFQASEALCSQPSVEG